MEAEIVLDYDDAQIAEAIASAVSPDNFKTPADLSVKTTWKDGKALTRIECTGRLATFIATIDDLLSCVSTAERALQTTKRLE